MKRGGDREVVFKYHGLGNDFVLLDRRRSGGDVDSDAVKQLCDRRRGIGADGVLVLLPSDSAAARMVVHNADGSIAEMCGNGVRCVAKYLVDGSNQKPKAIRLETAAGLLSCEVFYRDEAADEVQVSMGPARLVADNLPSRLSGQPFINQELSGFSGLKGTAVSMGTPHLILFETPLAQAAQLGPKLERSAAFPGRTNVGFAQLRDRGIQLRVWERGAGLTQACGTGACAAVAAAVAEQRLRAGSWVPVTVPGGVLQVRCEPDFSNVEMRGPAAFVFEASVSLSPTAAEPSDLPTAESSAPRTPGSS
jgi:diaminopimelate epimerase